MPRAKLGHFSGLAGWQRAGLLLFAVVHLGLALGSAANAPIAARLVHSPAAIYGSLGGVTTRFGFFAPNVGTQLKAQFAVLGADGQERQVDLSENAGRESALRRDNIIATFWYGLRNENMARSVTSSWASRIFARNPPARQVKVAVSIYDLPSMAGWREGRRAAWQQIYEATYRH